MIESASIDIDVDDSDDMRPKPVAYLRLEGDFTKEFEKYLADDDATGVSLQLPRSEADSLYTALTEVLYG